MNALAFARALHGGRAVPSIVLVLGDDAYLRDAALRALDKRVVDEAMRVFNVDRYTAGETSVDTVISAARTVPMMSERRLVVVRAVERWESESGAANLDALAEYAKAPIDSACVVLVAEKMHGSRKLVTMAKKEAWLVDCASLDADAIVPVLLELAEARGKKMSSALARTMVERAGTDLAVLEDSMERMALYAGERPELDEEDVRVTVSKVRQGDTWDLVRAVGTRKAADALLAFAESYEPKDRGLPMVGALAWSIRQMVKVHDGVARGMAPDAAAKAAGAYSPARAKELVANARRFSKAELTELLCSLATADRELKGAKRSPRFVLESTLLRSALASKAS